MASDPTRAGADAPQDPEELRELLDASQAGSDHWRQVAATKTAAYERLVAHPVVRLALATDERLEPVRGLVARTRARTRRGIDRVRLVAAASRAHPSKRSGPPRRSPRSGPQPNPARPPVTVIRIDSLSADEIAGRVDEAPHDLVCLVGSEIEPDAAAWVSDLADAMGGDIAAATPLVLHPIRRWLHATPHDGLIRSAGLVIGQDANGAPTVRARQAGTAPQHDDAVADIDAFASNCVLLSRALVRSCGGFGVGLDAATAGIELSARIRAAGLRIVVVPSVRVTDRRPIGSLAELDRPVATSGPAWQDLVERAGPRLRRLGTPEDSSRTMAITVAAPEASAAPRWGDWHLADALARHLAGLGQRAELVTLDRVDDPAVRSSDVHLVIRGLSRVRTTPGQRHVLWIISHPESIEQSEIDEADLVLVASERFAEHLASRTSTPVEVLLQATDTERFRPVPGVEREPGSIVVVAKTRGQARPMVTDAIAAGYRPRVHGAGWRGVIDPSLIVADHVDNERLPALYAAAGVVLNDHWPTMRTWGFVSNRLFDVLACGTPVISDPVVGLTAALGDAVLTADNSDELRTAIESVLDDPREALDRAERGRATVRARHGFERRAGELLETLTRHGF